MLTAVALLGAEMPGVDGLADLADVGELYGVAAAKTVPSRRKPSHPERTRKVPRRPSRRGSPPAQPPINDWSLNMPGSSLLPSLDGRTLTVDVALRQPTTIIAKQIAKLVDAQLLLPRSVTSSTRP